MEKSTILLRAIIAVTFIYLGVVFLLMGHIPGLIMSTYIPWLVTRRKGHEGF